MEEWKYNAKRISMEGHKNKEVQNHRNWPITKLQLIKYLSTVALSCFMMAQFVYAADSADKAQHGKASYYADRFNGRKTANGEIFSNSKLTAASNGLKFGTHVRVINVKNSKSVVVKINDTGKFGRGVIIDLSKSAFKRIAPLTQGIVKVRVEVVKRGKGLNK